MYPSYGPYTTFVPDPVRRFLTAWNEMNISAKLREKSLPDTILTALGNITNPEVREIVKPIQNTFAKDMGLLNAKNQVIHERRAELTFTHLFTFVFPELAEIDRERVLAYFGRVSCWQYSELVSLDWTDLVAHESQQVEPRVAEVIKKFNQADVEIHEFSVRHFKDLISGEVDLDSDIMRMRQLRETIAAKVALTLCSRPLCSPAQSAVLTTFVCTLPVSRF
eukprot:m.334416 g.334416  ORF g.334416 m.334416 type:complete len:222 (+) comp55666_c0_seq16:3321-3986(+)